MTQFPKEKNITLMGLEGLERRLCIFSSLLKLSSQGKLC